MLQTLTLCLSLLCHPAGVPTGAGLVVDQQALTPHHLRQDEQPRPVRVNDKGELVPAYTKEK